MSRENVEVVRGFLAPRNGENLVPLMRGVVERFGPDFPRDPILGYWAEDPVWRHVDPEIEWTSELPGLSRAVKGPRELLEWWKELVEVWDSYVYTTVELRDLGDWVLNIADVRARGRQGVDVEMRVYELARVQNEKITSYRAAVRSEEEALKASDLKE